MDTLAGDSGGFGQNLRRERIRAGLTQEQLAELSGLSVRTISDIERGRTAQPHRSSVDLLARVLGLTVPVPTVDDRAPKTVAVAESPRPAPAQLPVNNADFTGRRLTVDQMCAGLTAPRERGAGAVCAVIGMGGIGKTTLAVHVAHLVRAHYPDGQLYVDLHGSTPAATPAADVLARFLRDLGVTGDSIPDDEQERATLYRSVLAGRRILILLDNAADAAQVRPLIPGESGCAVIVTSRAEMSALPAVHRVGLESLEPDEAAALLDRLIGARWQAADRSTVESVLDACAGLPLALDIVARRLASRPNWSLGTLAERLADQHHRLDELLAGDLAVRVSFMVSYAAIGGDTDPGRRLFRLLGLVDTATLGLPAVAALDGRPAEETRRTIEVLVDVHLVESPAPYRYRLHDLLGVYAAERARAEEPSAEQDAALRRLVTFYVRTTQMTAVVINPHRRRVPLGPPEPGIELVEFTDYPTALAWLDTEFDNLMAAVRLAQHRGWHDLAWRLPLAMWDLFALRAHRYEAIEALQIALASARHLDDLGTVTWVLNQLGAALVNAGRIDEAITTLRLALPLARELGDRRVEATILSNIGACHEDLEEFESAIEMLERALPIFQEIGAQASVVTTYNLLGSVEYGSGRFDRALDQFRQGLTLGAAIGDDYGRARALDGMSEVMRDLGRLAEAEECSRESAVLSRRTGHRAEEAYALLVLTDVLARRDDITQARRHWREAQAILEEAHIPKVAKLRDQLAARWQLIGFTAG